jgi:hypothetical protein
MSQDEEAIPAHAGERVPVVWLHDPDDTRHYWERDWLAFLLSGLPVTHHDSVNTKSQPLRDALLIFGNDIAQADVRAYIESYRRADCRHGLIHLSDEYVQHDISYYDAATVVFRTYYRPGAPSGTFGLGYKQGFWDGYIGLTAAALTVTDRPYVWSFAGQVEKGDRPRMIQAFSGIKPRFVHRTSFWNSPDYLSIADYRAVLLRTVFVPSPPGTYSLDCFRTYEALEAGCVPIVLRQTAAQPFDYYRQLFGAMGFAEPVPFLQVAEWKEAAAFVRRASNDAFNLERLRLECHGWWTRYKEHTRSCFTHRVRDAFQLEAR